MGATNFSDSGWIIKKKGHEYSSSDISPLYNDLVDDAERRYGDEYTGEINMTDGFMMCGVMTKKQFKQGMDWWGDYTGKPAPKFLRDAGLDKKWKAADDKWGSACAVIIKDELKDATIVSAAFITDKGIIPVPKREKDKYTIQYKTKRDQLAADTRRVPTVPDAWKWIKDQLKKNPQFQVDAIQNSYTYARPKIGHRTKQAKKVAVEFFGTAAI